MSNNLTQNEVSGVLLINKPSGMTSHDVVNRIRRLYNTRRVGHTGTLDPMATGVLVVLVGRAAKAAEYLSHDTKEYIATLKLGIMTDTEDTTGNVLSSVPDTSLPSSEDVINICNSFIGEILQTPPMYSALKVGGKKLCDIARSGGVVEREARPIKIFKLECSPTANASEYTLRVRCSGGTYIRTLCADIGQTLGCGGAMASLCRVETSGFPIEECYTLEQLEALDFKDLSAKLLPIERLFAELPSFTPPQFYVGLSRNGCVMYQKKVGTSLPVGCRVRLYDAAKGNIFYALGEVGEYPDSDAAPEGDQTAIKVIKLFDL